jgi:large subunit ribosomal protein L11
VVLGCVRGACRAVSDGGVASVVVIRGQAFEDRTFAFEVLPPPTSWFLKRVTGCQKGAKMTGKETATTVSLKAVYEIAVAKQKYDPLSAVVPLDSLVRSICGTARSMGFKLTR